MEGFPYITILALVLWALMLCKKQMAASASQLADPQVAMDSWVSAAILDLQ
jgi:hypothetical protein